MADDEDVVFANSPLYEHLKDIGFSDFDIRPVEKEKVVSAVETSRLESRYSELCSRVVNKVKAAVVSVVFPGGGEDVALHEEKSTAVKLRDSKILLEDDYVMLERFLEGDDNSNKPLISKPKLSLRRRFIMIVIVLVLASVVQNVFLGQSCAYLYSYWLVTALLIICPTIFVTRRRSRAANGGRFACISLYIDAMEELLYDMKRSLRLVQESELIARGYTLVTAKSPVARLESVVRGRACRQCPQLREAVFVNTRECVLAHRKQTRDIVRNVALLPELDNVSQYICEIPLDDYGECLRPDFDGRFDDSTDDYSMPAIKAMYHVCLIQCSEFVRRLAMSFVVDARSQHAPLSCVEIDAVTTSISALLAVTLPARDSMKRSYNFHKCAVLEPKTSPTLPKKSVVVDEGDAPMEAVRVAVHSLELHLLGALKRVRDFDSEIVNFADDERTMLGEYELIKRELESSANCWEEGENRIKKRFHPREVEKLVEQPAVIVPSTCEQVPVPIFDMGDPVIEDEMFELITDGKSHVRPLENGEFTDVVSWELELAKKKERTEAVRVLKELKCVISPRANELLEREQKALDVWRKRVGLDEVNGSGGNDDNEDKNDLLKTISDSRKIENGEVLESDSALMETGVEDRTKYKPKDWEYSDDEIDETTGEYVWSDRGDNKHEITLPDPARGSLVDRIGAGGGASFAFTANIAAMAAARSQGLTQDTFGDSSDDDDDNDDCIRD
ncbi:vezatin-like [Tubulanus polymorphus]|uniref:vezatin-like n=1 Tax=Tubulanus polymorphus TaxID=672921 RepID=UPI003DA4B26F